MSAKRNVAGAADMVLRADGTPSNGMPRSARSLGAVAVESRLAPQDVPEVIAGWRSGSVGWRPESQALQQRRKREAIGSDRLDPNARRLKDGAQVRSHVSRHYAPATAQQPRRHGVKTDAVRNRSRWPPGLAVALCGALLVACGS